MPHRTLYFCWSEEKWKKINYTIECAECTLTCVSVLHLSEHFSSLFSIMAMRGKRDKKFAALEDGTLDSRPDDAPTSGCLWCLQTVGIVIVLIISIIALIIASINHQDLIDLRDKVDNMTGGALSSVTGVEVAGGSSISVNDQGLLLIGVHDPQITVNNKRSDKGSGHREVLLGGLEIIDQENPQHQYGAFRVYKDMDTGFTKINLWDGSIANSGVYVDGSEAKRDVLPSGNEGLWDAAKRSLFGGGGTEDDDDAGGQQPFDPCLVPFGIEAGLNLVFYPSSYIDDSVVPNKYITKAYHGVNVACPTCDLEVNHELCVHGTGTFDDDVIACQPQRSLCEFINETEAAFSALNISLFNFIDQQTIINNILNGTIQEFIEQQTIINNFFNTTIIEIEGDIVELNSSIQTLEQNVTQLVVQVGTTTPFACADVQCAPTTPPSCNIYTCLGPGDCVITGQVSDCCTTDSHCSDGLPCTDNWCELHYENNFDVPEVRYGRCITRPKPSNGPGGELAEAFFADEATVIAASGSWYVLIGNAGSTQNASDTDELGLELNATDVGSEYVLDLDLKVNPSYLVPANGNPVDRITFEVDWHVSDDAGNLSLALQKITTTFYVEPSNTEAIAVSRSPLHQQIPVNGVSAFTTENIDLAILSTADSYGVLDSQTPKLKLEFSARSSDPPPTPMVFPTVFIDRIELKFYALEFDGCVHNYECDTFEAEVCTPVLDGSNITESCGCARDPGIECVSNAECPDANPNDCLVPECQPNGQCADLVLEGCCVTDNDCGNVTENGCLLVSTCTNGHCNRVMKDEDADGVPCDQDCDDTNPAVGRRSKWFADADADGFGNNDDFILSCNAVGIWNVTVGGDCDDDNAAIFPGATEECDGLDNDCDGSADEDFLGGGFLLGTPCTVGVGACARQGVRICETTTTTVCSATAGSPTVEVCDGVDNDCDGVVDNDPPGLTVCSTQLGSQVATANCVLDNSSFPTPAYVCDIDTCLGVYQDCNYLNEDGCESDTARDPNNCGGCGLAFACAADLICVDSQCVSPFFEAVDCWDLNADYICQNLTEGAPGNEDINQDGECNALDCAGSPCWDLNGNLQCDPAEDINGVDGCTQADCRGDQGLSSAELCVNVTCPSVGCEINVCIAGSCVVTGHISNCCEVDADCTSMNGCRTGTCIPIPEAGDGVTDKGYCQYAANPFQYGDCAQDADCSGVNDLCLNCTCKHVTQLDFSRCAADADCEAVQAGTVCTTYYRDEDQDNFGGEHIEQRCNFSGTPAGFVTVGGDCDDFEPTIFPGATELCDFLDNDCNQVVDDPFIGVLMTTCLSDLSTGVAAGSRCQNKGYNVCNRFKNDTVCNVRDLNPLPEVCNGLDDDCDGVVDNGFDLNTDVNNCGKCGAMCMPGPNIATWDCSVGVCTIQSCNAGFDDCDGIFENGCEVDLSHDVLNCGSCGPASACNDNEICIDSICQTLVQAVSNTSGLNGDPCENVTIPETTRAGDCKIYSCDPLSGIVTATGQLADCCQLSSDCDDLDNNPCTNVTCGPGGFCIYQLQDTYTTVDGTFPCLPAASSCANVNCSSPSPANGCRYEQCFDGICLQTGQLSNCCQDDTDCPPNDDNNPCTVHSCDLVAGQCITTFLDEYVDPSDNETKPCLPNQNSCDGVPCEELPTPANNCTIHHCFDGECKQTGHLSNCCLNNTDCPNPDDNNPCTISVCDPFKNQCVTTLADTYVDEITNETLPCLPTSDSSCFGVNCSVIPAPSNGCAITNCIGGSCVVTGHLSRCCDSDADCAVYDDNNPCTNHTCNLVDRQCETVFVSDYFDETENVTRSCFNNVDLCADVVLPVPTVNSSCLIYSCDPQTGDIYPTGQLFCCDTAADCDDYNPCTDDICSTCNETFCGLVPICSYVPRDNYTVSVADPNNPGEFVNITFPCLAATPQGVACWDLNADFACDLSVEDINGDGDCTAADCAGAPCWDLNGDLNCTLPDEDKNGDGACNITDCFAQNCAVDCANIVPTIADECRLYSCNLATGQCERSGHQSNCCDGNNTQCDDGNPCTDDICPGAGQSCQYVFRSNYTRDNLTLPCLPDGECYCTDELAEITAENPFSLIEPTEQSILYTPPLDVFRRVQQCNPGFRDSFMNVLYLGDFSEVPGFNYLAPDGVSAIDASARQARLIRANMFNVNEVYLCQAAQLAAELNVTGLTGQEFTYQLQIPVDSTNSFFGVVPDFYTVFPSPLDVSAPSPAEFHYMRFSRDPANIQDGYRCALHGETMVAASEITDAKNGIAPTPDGISEGLSEVDFPAGQLHYITIDSNWDANNQANGGNGALKYRHVSNCWSDDMCTTRGQATSIDDNALTRVTTGFSDYHSRSNYLSHWCLERPDAGADDDFAERQLRYSDAERSWNGEDRIFTIDNSGGTPYDYILIEAFINEDYNFTQENDATPLLSLPEYCQNPRLALFALGNSCDANECEICGQSASTTLNFGMNSPANQLQPWQRTQRHVARLVVAGRTGTFDVALDLSTTYSPQENAVSFGLNEFEAVFPWWQFPIDVRVSAYTDTVTQVDLCGGSLQTCDTGATTNAVVITGTDRSLFSNGWCSLDSWTPLNEQTIRYQTAGITTPGSVNISLSLTNIALTALPVNDVYLVVATQAKISTDNECRCVCTRINGLDYNVPNEDESNGAFKIVPLNNVTSADVELVVQGAIPAAATEFLVHFDVVVPTSHTLGGSEQVSFDVGRTCQDA